jgi:AraC-like DNA-binding protein/uncharacterized damage-inducible protein DinB
MTPTSRDRLRELLDAVLDDEHHDLDAMADGAAASPFHFSRQLRAMAGEPPVTMKRRVLLERAAWRLGRGASVTEVAIEAGYESIDGFGRAFQRAYGHAPSATSAATPAWLPSPNGVHFHPPSSLWVHQATTTLSPPLGDLVAHDLDDTAALLAHAATVPEEALTRTILDGTVVLDWDGPETSVLAVLHHHVRTKEVWLAAIEGADEPSPSDRVSVAGLASRQAAVGERWRALVTGLDARQAWDDRLVDALCDPPQSFTMRSVMTHVLTFAAHRRQLARLFLRLAGHPTDQGDPIDWAQRPHRETP